MANLNYYPHLTFSLVGGAVASWLVRSTPEREVRGHCVVFFGKTLYSHSASLHPDVEMGTDELNAER